MINKDLDIPFVQNGSLVLCFDEVNLKLWKNYTTRLNKQGKGLKV